jgi:hypothetical protein
MPTVRRRVLLSNGRFPVSLDLARQLEKDGHHVYCVDPMEYHICKFSVAVKKSYEVPSPREDARGYIEAVKRVIADAKIDIIIPLHEEIFYLAECGDSEILSRLFAPKFDSLMELHNKWNLVQFLKSIGLDVPDTKLCRNMEDVKSLDISKDMSLKPTIGRAASNIHQLIPDKQLPNNLDVDEDNNYVAQEWLYGNRFCSYSVIKAGRVQAHAVYPVKDTLDGNSCVYFECVEHGAIYHYVSKLASALGRSFTGQLGFDFIETDSRLAVIDCNPRATSGIHLFSGKRSLAKVFTSNQNSNQPNTARPGRARQVAPGMLMAPRHTASTWRQYFKHMFHLMTTKDVMFRWIDLFPTLMQPFLLTSYYEICREKGGLSISDMFQWDFIWEPKVMRGKNKLASADRMLDGDSGLGE